jgi:hypothetical protein
MLMISAYLTSQVFTSKTAIFLGTSSLFIRVSAYKSENYEFLPPPNDQQGTAVLFATYIFADGSLHT